MATYNQRGAVQSTPRGRASVMVQDLSVRYNVPSTNKKVYREANLFNKLQAKVLGKHPRVSVRALRNVTFTSYTGESIGILGRNGSGKSTLLRIIAGLETPSGGQVYASSQPLLLGVSAAILPQMTGEKNAFLGCLAMGMSPDQAEKALPEIIDLAGLEDSIYLPMETYSSGMAARLRFAIATAAKPEILLIDEALNTGDAAFKKRSEDAMNSLRESAGTVFLVSHAAQTIEETCSRAIWLHNGQMIAQGDAKTLALKYRKWSWDIAQGRIEDAEKVLDRYLLEASLGYVMEAGD